MTHPRFNQWKIHTPKSSTHAIAYKVPLFITVDTHNKEITVYNKQYGFKDVSNYPVGNWRLRLTHNGPKVELEKELVGEYTKPHWRG